MNILYDVIMYVSKQHFQLIKKGQIITKKGCNSIFYSQIHEISLLIYIYLKLGTKYTATALTVT